MAEVSSYEEYSHFFEVKLNRFSGPIDLLLHLVKLNELPIEELSLAQICNQYLDCLEKMRRFDLEVAGEYLVIAATLLSIKAKVLLDEPVELIPDEEGNLINPHEELLRRLREAEVYKDGARWLGDLQYLGIDVFSSPSKLRYVKSAPTPFKDHDPMLLGKAFRKILEKVEEDAARYTITLESVSIVERMMAVIETLKNTEENRIVFYKLIPDLTVKAEVVGTFVALLELCKRQVITVMQDENFDEILIVLASVDTSTENLESEFDEPVPGQTEDLTVNA